jgi:hypothetical protein
MPAIDLSSLDHPPPLDLDLSIFQHNLTALRKFDVALADLIRQAGIAPHWSAARALDDFATWRIEGSDEQQHWLDHTALPRRRAAVIAAAARPEQSVALPSIGTGAEVIALMERVGPLAGVFVFEPSLSTLAAVLRTVDLAEAIASSRCVIVPNERGEAHVTELLREYTGLLPPARVIQTPGTAQQRMEEVHGLCDRVARVTAADRDARMGALIPCAPQPDAGSGVAILSLTAEARAWALARDLQSGAAAQGVESRVCLADGPRNAHALVHALRLEGFTPRVTICVDHPPTAAPFPLAGVPCQWHTRSIDGRGDRVAPDVVHLAATPAIAAELATVGIEAANCVDFFFGVNEQRVCEPVDATFSRNLVLIADLPSDQPHAYGVVQPTHKILWEALRKCIDAHWTMPEFVRAEAILRRAERRSRVEIKEAALRARLLRIVERGLIPAVVLEKIVLASTQSGLDCVLIGTGWREMESPHVTVLAASVQDLTETQWKARPVAAVFSCLPNPLTRDLVTVAGRGWPILLHAPDGKAARRALGGLLEPDRHYLPFSNPREMSGCIRDALADPSATTERAQRTVGHLQARHSYANRIQDLLSWISAREAGGS